jgi:hypothetical protein
MASKRTTFQWYKEYLSKPESRSDYKKYIRDHPVELDLGAIVLKYLFQRVDQRKSVNVDLAKEICQHVDSEEWKEAREKLKVVLGVPFGDIDRDVTGLIGRILKLEPPLETVLVLSSAANNKAYLKIKEYVLRKYHDPRYRPFIETCFRTRMTRQIQSIIRTIDKVYRGDPWTAALFLHGYNRNIKGTTRHAMHMILVDFWKNANLETEDWSKDEIFPNFVDLAEKTLEIFPSSAGSPVLHARIRVKIFDLMKSMANSSHSRPVHLPLLLKMNFFTQRERNLANAYVTFSKNSNIDKLVKQSPALSRLPLLEGRRILTKVMSTREHIKGLLALIQWEKKEITPQTFASNMSTAGFQMSVPGLVPTVQRPQFLTRDVSRVVGEWELRRKEFLKTGRTEHLFWGNYIITRFCIKALFFLSYPLMMMARRRGNNKYYGTVNKSDSLEKFLKFLELVRTKYETYVRASRNNKNVEQSAWKMFDADAARYLSGEKTPTESGAPHLGMFQLAINGTASCMDRALLAIIECGVNDAVARGGLICQSSKFRDNNRASHFALSKHSANFSQGKQSTYSVVAVATQRNEIFEVLTTGMGYRVLEYQRHIMDAITKNKLSHDPSWNRGLELFFKELRTRLVGQVGKNTIWNRSYAKTRNQMENACSRGRVSK